MFSIRVADGNHRWLVDVFCPETVLNTTWTLKSDWYPPNIVYIVFDESVGMFE